jgi:hypothetical protein
VLHAIPADARTFVLKSDGTGDVPTFQAGIDSLVQNGGSPDDMLLVQPGYYDEDVVIEPHSRLKGVIYCPSGAESTQVKSLRGFNEPPFDAFSRQFRATGLGVRQTLRFGFGLNKIDFRNCIFVGDATFESFWIWHIHGGLIADCEFRGRLDLAGTELTVSSCRFTGGTAHFTHSSDYVLDIEDCVFDSDVDTAVVAVGYEGPGFSRCTFKGGGLGIVVIGGGRYRGIRDCQFDGIRGAAIAIIPSSETQFPLYSAVSVERCKFLNCGSALLGLPGLRLNLVMGRDTVLACRDIAIEANPGYVFMDSVIVRGSGGTGAKLKQVAGAPASTISHCRFEDNGGAGLSYRDTIGVGLTASENLFSRNAGAGFECSTALSRFSGAVVIQNNTSALNGGDGLRVILGDNSGALIENNIVAGNRGDGIAVEGPAGGPRHNDAWMNGGAPYSGPVDADSNLTLDPQFCNPLAGDFRLTGSSPCASSGPFGQIGALGVGCDASTVPIDIRPGSPVNSVSRGSKGALPLAILSHGLFDARQVDLTSVRLAGTPADDRWWPRDVNGDGLVDFVTQANAGDLGLADGEVTLEARTFYGAPLRGTDEVRLVGSRANRASSEAEPENLLLSIRSLSPARAGSALRLTLTLPTTDPVEVLLLDIAGRRVDGRRLESPQRGVSVLDLAPALHAGIYWLRVRQAGNEVRSKICLLP